MVEPCPCSIHQPLRWSEPIFIRELRMFLENAFLPPIGLSFSIGREHPSAPPVVRPDFHMGIGSVCVPTMFAPYRILSWGSKPHPNDSYEKHIVKSWFRARYDAKIETASRFHFFCSAASQFCGKICVFGTVTLKNTS